MLLPRAKLKRMKVVVLYRPNSEFARSVEDFMRSLRELHSLDDRHLEVINYDSREGSAMASVYDIMSQPAILIVNDDGSYVKHWEGSSLPLQEEVTSYMYSLSSP
jgi:hypothetical protein